MIGTVIIELEYDQAVLTKTDASTIWRGNSITRIANGTLRIKSLTARSQVGCETIQPFCVAHCTHSLSSSIRWGEGTASCVATFHALSQQCSHQHRWPDSVCNAKQTNLALTGVSANAVQFVNKVIGLELSACKCQSAQASRPHNKAHWWNYKRHTDW